MIERISCKDNLYAIIVRQTYNQPGVNFITSDDLSQQLAYISHSEGKVIEPHIHNPVPREVKNTQEILFIKKGKLRVDFYTEDREYFESTILVGGDVILLIQGGHGFEVLEEIEMFEVKQGPYAGDQDKTRFTPLANKGKNNG